MVRNKAGKGKRSNQSDYIGAPYNFIPIAENTYEYDKKQRPNHNDMKPGLLSGCLSYTIEAKTPIMIDGGKKDKDGSGIGEFYKDVNGHYAIPGSSIRGLVRSNAQILSFSDISEDIDNYALMYRDVTTKSKNPRYEEILGKNLSNVYAGYIVKKENQYQIYSNKLGQRKKNYYSISERKIIEDYQECNKKGEKSPYSYLFSKEFPIMQYDKKAEFEERMERKRMVCDVKDNNMINKNYKPYYIKISYRVQKDEIIGIEKAGSLENDGYILSSGAIRQKKVIFIIPDIDWKNPVRTLSKEEIQVFQRDFEKRKTQIKNPPFFNLPMKDGKEKPVFYTKDQEINYVGFTPHLRVCYDKTIKDGIKQEKISSDYCRAMFGTISNNEPYQSRLSFQDASIVKEKDGNLIKMFLASPKPTSCLNYIENVDKNTPSLPTYHDNFQLRGIKQYWLHKQADPEIQENIKNNKMITKMYPLQAGSVFQGKIRFHNLRPDELGLLIWSVELNPRSQQNIGKAKAHGYGRVAIHVDKLEVFDYDSAYNLEQLLLNPMKKIEKEPYIKVFKGKMKQFLGRDLEAMPNIQDFFLMKEIIPKKEKIRYMTLKEYQIQKKPLPKIKEIKEKNNNCILD